MKASQHGLFDSQHFLKDTRWYWKRVLWEDGYRDADATKRKLGQGWPTADILRMDDF